MPRFFEAHGLGILLMIGLAGAGLTVLVGSRPQGRPDRARGKRLERWLPQSRRRWGASPHEILHDPDYLGKILEAELGSDPASGDQSGERRD